jgi:hypothetical protein
MDNNEKIMIFLSSVEIFAEAVRISHNPLNFFGNADPTLYFDAIGIKQSAQELKESIKKGNYV